MRSSEPSSRSAANSRSSASRLASRAPSHRIAGPIRAEQREVGADGERRQRDDDQEEQHADAGAAADADRQPQVANEQRGERAHARPQRQFACAIKPDRPVRRGKDQAAAGKVLPHQVRRASPARRVERRGRLVQQPERPLDGEQPRDRQPPPLPGREIGRRQVGHAVEPDRRQRRRRTVPSGAEIGGPEPQILGRPSARASARPDGRDNAPARRCCARRRRRRQPEPARWPPAQARRSCAAARICRLPFGPVTSSASPPASEKSRPAKTTRPPRPADQIGSCKPHQPAPRGLSRVTLPRTGRRKP